MPPDARKRQKADSMKEIIHSGHFMVSDIDDSEIQELDDVSSLVVHESDCDQESLPMPASGFDFESACKETSKTYTFGNRSTHSISIDASLTKLFECMTLAYSGKLTSPRWKQFKGLKLRLKEKIRLNNMIWRAWHMQFVMKIKTDKLCQFATPLDGDTHMKPEAVVIEGTYWKRRMANITAEYQKWRLFYRDRSRHQALHTHDVSMDLEHGGRWGGWPKEPFLGPPMDEDFLMDFSDTLFSSLNASQPFDFPNPREIAAKAGIADFIQPGLVQLQPSVDDFMDTLEPLSDLFSDFLNSKLPTLAEEGAFSTADSSSYHQDPFGAPKSTPSHLFSPSPVRTFGAPDNRRKYAASRPQQTFPMAPPQGALRIEESPKVGEFLQPSAPFLPPDPFTPVQVPLEPLPVAKEPKFEAKPQPIFFPAQAEEAPAFRRHSYATGTSGDYVGVRRSRPIAPAPPFAVPEPPPAPVGARGRTRSRSVSSPQSGSSRTVQGTRGPLGALSLTDVSSATPPDLSSAAAQPTAQLLAHLLSTGCSSQDLGRAVLKVTSTGATTSPVTIIRPVLSTTAHTFVFSPAVTTAVEVSEIQRNLLTSDPRSPAARVLAAPDSPGSSTCSSSPAIPAISFEASPPAGKGPRPRSHEEKIQYREHRRVCHINAEQKRRCNIKNGFESLQGLLPPVGHVPPAKISKAAMLQRGAEYIRTLRAERQQQLEEAEKLRQQIEQLNQAISAFQGQLPASGAPVACQRTNKLRERFQEYVRQQTLRNWKFWIFSLIVEPLVDSFNSCVSTSSLDEMCKSILTWLDQHCSLVALRPGVLNSLRLLSTTTNILTDPSRMPEEAARAVAKREPRRQ